MPAAEKFLFVQDAGLRKTLADRYEELLSLGEKTGCSFSVIFLSMSIVEGIFGYLKEYHGSKIKQTQAFANVMNRSRQKDEVAVFNRLSIPNIYGALHELGVLQVGKGFEHVCDVARIYRNCIHTNCQISEGLTIGPDKADLARAVLESVLAELQHLRFLNDSVTLRCVCGNAQVDGQNELRIIAKRRPRMSTVILTENNMSSSWNFCCECTVTDGLVLDILVDYQSNDRYKCVRLDWRKDKGSGLYRCLAQGELQKISEITLESPKTVGGQVNIQFNLDVKARTLVLLLDGKPFNFGVDDSVLGMFAARVTPSRKCGFQTHLCSMRMLFNEFAIDPLPQKILPRLSE